MQVGWAKKRDSGRISGFAAYSSTVLSTVRVAKCEKQSRDERRQASSTHRGVRRPLFEQDDDEVSVTGSTLYAGDEGRSPPPLVIITSFSAAVGHRRRVFLLKTDNNPYSDRPRRGS